MISSEYVVVDITYPNPNVFYELGLRHAVRNKTILIKEKGSNNNPFDITGLRYYEYENTPTGLKKLKGDLKNAFAVYDENKAHIDNEFLYVALSFGVFFQKIRHDKKNDGKKKVLKELLTNKDLMSAIMSDDQEKAVELFSNVDNIDQLISGLVDSGMLDE